MAYVGFKVACISSVHHFRKNPKFIKTFKKLLMKLMKPKIDLVSMLLVNVDGRALVPVAKERKVKEVSPAWHQY